MEQATIYTDELSEIDFNELLMTFLSKAGIIVSVMILCAAIAGSITHFLIDPTYTATSTVYLLPRGSESLTQKELQIGSQMTNDAARLAKSKAVIEPVLHQLQLPMDYEELYNIISVENPSDTRLLQISAEIEDPQLAADIANAMADSLSDQVASIMQTDRPTIAEKAEAPEKPSSPNMTKNIIIAAFLGLFSSIALISITFIMDDTIKTQEDVSKYLQLNTLASIPLEFSDENTSGIRQKLRWKGK